MDDVSHHMRTMDLILRTDTSGCPWGRDIIEAMSNGLPVIACGTSEVFIKSGINGFLYNKQDIDEMASYIFKIVENPLLRAKMSKESLFFAQEHFSPQKNSDKIYEILNKVVK